MFRYAIFIILSVAAFSAAAQAASPCNKHSGGRCAKPAIAAASRAGSHAGKKAATVQTATANKSVETPKSYAPAEALLTRLLAERQSKLGESHPLALTTANALAVIYKAEGRYDEAQALFRTSLEASQMALGKEHPVTVAARKGLVAVYKAQGRDEEARQAAAAYSAG
jgi:tetratricopeptide (TPR) repeat protein